MSGKDGKKDADVESKINEIIADGSGLGELTGFYCLFLSQITSHDWKMMLQAAPIPRWKWTTQRLSRRNCPWLNNLQKTVCA